MLEIFELDEVLAEVPVPVQEEPAPPSKPILFIATPCYGCMMNSMYLECLLRLQGECIQRGVPCMIDILGNESLVQRARNILTKRFLASPATHLFFIDSDIGFMPASVFRLLAFDKDVVTGVYPKKYLNWDQVAAKLGAGETSEPVHAMGLDFNINIKGTEVESTDGFVPVLDSATGFMLIKRQVVERMYSHYAPSLTVVNDIIGDASSIKDYVAIFDCMIDPVTKRALSEDFSACRRWQQMGGEIWVDIASPLCHRGGYMYNGDIRQRLATPTPQDDMDKLD